MIPDKIGRYEIEKELGRGGMAVVYLARDPLVNRRIAIKVLPRQFTFDPQFRARFQREAQVIAALDHPAIVPVYDFGEKDDQPYIVMRFMSGGSLSDMLRERGPFPVAEAAHILARIGSALDESHQKGVVHRDLKPDNILFDDRNDAFVSDFGIVKVSEATVQYTGNAIIGTPGYMSPEQARGDMEIDGRSDVYSLGAIAYEMLTGKLPYQSDTPMGMAMKHIMEPVPNVLDVNPTLPASSGVVISKAMAKDRADRYQLCTEIGNELASAPALASDPTSVDTAFPMDATIVDAPFEKSPEYTARSQQIAYPPPSEVETRSLTQTIRKLPVWVWGAGCLAVIACAALTVGLGGFGLFQTMGDDEPATAVAEVTHEPTTPQVNQSATATLDITPSIVPVINYANYTSDISGVSVSYPDIWYVDEDLDFIALASDPALIEADEIQSGAIALVVAGNASEFQGAGPSDMLTNAVAELEFDEGVALTSGPNLTTINGQEAATGEIEFTADNGVELLSLVAMIIQEQRAAFVMAATPSETENEYRPLMEAIIQSVGLSEPIGSVLTDNIEGSMNVGDSLSGAVVSGTRSVWTLSGQQQEIVTLRVVPDTEEFDVIVDVLDQSGNSILDSGPVDASFGAEEIEDLTLPYSGEYQIIVQGYEGTSGNYGLSVLPSTAIADDGEPGTILLVSDAIEPDGFSHSFPFFAISAGSIVTAFVEPVSDFDVLVSIYNGDTDELIEEMDSSFGDELLVFTTPSRGNFYFTVDGYEDTSGEYEIALFGPPDIQFMLAPGDELITLFDEAAVIDYLYRAEQGETISILIEPDSNLDILVGIIDQDTGNTLIEIDDGLSGESEELTFTFPQAAVFVIRVTEFYGELGGYYLFVE